MANTAVRANIGTTHPTFKTKQADVERVRAAFLCDTDNFLNSTYIARHVYESKEQYDKRISRAFAIPFMRRAVQDIVRAVFNGNILRTGSGLAKIGGLVRDADGYGATLNQVMGNVARTAILYSGAFTLVDYVADPSRLGKELANITAYDLATNTEIMPHVRVFAPDQMTNWSLIPRYGFEAVLFKYKKVVGTSQQDVYLYADYECIEELDASGKALSEKWEHNLGYTPVVPCFFDSTFVDSNFGKTLFPGQRAVANLCSVVDEICERHAFSQLVCPDDGQMAELGARESDQLPLVTEYGDLDGPRETGQDRVVKKISQSAVFTFPSGTGHPPSFISPDVSQLGEVWGVVKDMVAMYLHAAGVADKSGALDQTLIEAVGTEVGAALARHEERVLRIASAYVSGTPDIYVSYPAIKKRADYGWLTDCQTVAGSTFLSDDAKAAVIEHIIDGSAPDMSKQDFERVRNGIEIKTIEQAAPGNGTASGDTSK